MSNAIHLSSNAKLLHSKAFDILWQDMDAYQHVNNSIYFVYMQECRFDWMKCHNIITNSQSIAPVLAAASCKFIKPITYPQSIVVNLYFKNKIGKKIYFEHIIHAKDNPEHIFALGEATCIWFDFVTQKSIDQPEEYQYLLET